MQSQLQKRGGKPVRSTPEFVEVGDKIIASALWAAPDGPDQERFMVFTIHDAKIIDMQGFATRREAERFAKRQ